MRMKLSATWFLPRRGIVSARWNSGYNVSRQVITRISNREIAIYSARAHAGEEAKGGKTDGRKGRRITRLATSDALYARNRKVVTACRSLPRRPDVYRCKRTPERFRF